jgi:hypothetical protein
MTSDERERIARVYADVFTSANGAIALEDMERVYHHRLSESVEIEAADIPHPFRAYYVEGQRSVIRALQAIVEAAKQGSL